MLGPRDQPPDRDNEMDKETGLSCHLASIRTCRKQSDVTGIAR
jgi:hypothetical protein